MDSHAIYYEHGSEKTDLHHENVIPKMDASEENMNAWLEEMMSCERDDGVQRNHGGPSGAEEANLRGDGKCGGAS